MTNFAPSMDFALGETADAIRQTYGLSKTDYESTRKRMRRALLREGLARRHP